ncbi:MAG: hypothetical protein Cons2KO_22540 [Congregibacter sp.]
MSAEQELRRLRYLEAMGRPVYVSRRVLPGAMTTCKQALKSGPKSTPTPTLQATAKPSHGAQAPVAEQILAGKTPERSEAEAGAKRGSVMPESLRASLRGTEPTSQTPVTASASDSGPPETDSPTPRAADSNVDRFQLAIVFSGQRLWVEDLQGDALAQDQLRLIGAMARALNHPEVKTAEPMVSQFNWPIVAGQQLELGPEEARASLEGFLQRKLDEAACVELICLGEPAWQRLQPLSLPCARRRTLSSRELLQDPSRKAQAWADLRA